MVEKSAIIKGQKIVHIWTLKSMYDNDSVGVSDGKGRQFRIKVTEFLKLFNDIIFSIEKKRVHSYLVIKEDNGGEKSGRRRKES